MFKAVIIDDEKAARDRLARLLSGFPDITVVGEAFDGERGAEMVNSLRPDIVFLDIEMPETDGLKAAGLFEYRPVIVFVTAFNKYAVQAFEAESIDYLLKPVTLERLEKTIQRIRRYVIKDLPDISPVLRQLSLPPEKAMRFSVKMHDEVFFIPEKDVYYFKAEDKYVFLCTNDASYYYDGTLKDLEETLDTVKFIRIHKSYIVAVDKIKACKKNVIGDFVIKLSDKLATELRIGRGFLDDVRKKLSF